MIYITDNQDSMSSATLVTNDARISVHMLKGRCGYAASGGLGDAVSTHVVCSRFCYFSQNATTLCEKYI